MIKLPRQAIAKLVDKNMASPRIMGKRVMKEWAILHHTAPTDFAGDLHLFREAVRFVSAGPGGE